MRILLVEDESGIAQFISQGLREMSYAVDFAHDGEEGREYVSSTGKGERGLSCPDIGCLFSSSYILTVCTNEKQLDNLVQKITPGLKKFGGVCLVTDAKWINH